MTAELQGIGADLGRRLADEVVRSPHIQKIDHPMLVRLLDRRGAEVMALLREAGMPDPDIARELDDMNAAFWNRIAEVADGLRHGTRGRA